VELIAMVRLSLKDRVEKIVDNFVLSAADTLQ
jgi:hypothetical protein